MTDRGVMIAVLYTTYVPLLTNSWYLSWIQPFNDPSSSEISANMQTCASPGYFFEVKLNDDIDQAMLKLFEKATQQARLTQ
jgi:hypothetical protein